MHTVKHNVTDHMLTLCRAVAGGLRGGLEGRGGGAVRAAGGVQRRRLGHLRAEAQADLEGAQGWHGRASVIRLARKRKHSEFS